MTNELPSPNGQLKIGVYVCDCGINIASKVNVPEVVEFAKQLPNVAVAREYKFMCSDPGQELIQKDIAELGINRVVVASCSPLLHEATFRKAIKDAELNEFFFQMANIREHVSWVTADPKEATSKAEALIAAAVRRISLAQPLERRTVPVHTDAMVIGGGIAGIHAALTIAESGKTVYLVEKEPTIGGHMAKFDKTFPTLDCSACILTPKMSSVKADPDIVLMTNSEVVDVSGYVGNFKVKVKRKARYVDEDKCTGCGECVSHCVVTNKVEIPGPKEEPPLKMSDREWVETTIASLNGHGRTSLMSVLLEINEQYHYLPQDMLDYVSWRLNVPQSKVYSIATFYKGFSLEPRGKYIIKVCKGTTCHVRGTDRNLDEFKRCIGLEPGQTTKDLKYTLEVVNCVGACAMGPVIVVNGKYHGNAGPETVHEILGLEAAVTAQGGDR